MEENEKALVSAARLAGEKGLTRFTRFLDPAQALQAQTIAREYGACFASFGGFPDAERCVGCFYPAGETPQESEYPLVCMKSTYASKFVTLTHRDILGAFMSLGLTRSCVGDIIIDNEDVYLFALSANADFIAAALTSAGRASLSFSVQEGLPEMPEPKGTFFHAVVSSLRLDAVAAAAYHLSRSEAADAIHAGLVKLSHIPCERVDASVAEGALLSMKGHGRVRLAQVEGLTRKQRIGITLFRYE